jgi:hypothetical protein
MGYSISWLAIRGEDVTTVHLQLGVSGTGEYEEVPESPLLGAKLPEGWYLVFANQCDYADNAPLASLSRIGELITCSVEEHCMCSSASGWNNGVPAWSVVHDSQQGLQHLDAQGDLPPVFSAVRDRLSTAQAQRGDADYIFDVPVEVAKAITGFRHDDCEPTVRFERLLGPSQTNFPGVPKTECDPKERIEPRSAPRKWWQIWR